MAKRDPLEGFSFHPEPDLETLISHQGVSPVEDLDELSLLWPVNDDPDALLQFILSERQHRRALIQP